MTQNYRFSNALGYTFEQMSEMHNASFSGYFVPIEMTPEMTADFWRLNNIDALRSVVMRDEDGAFVGMARRGTRGKRGWCGGFGIVPEFRGRGASTLLAEQMIKVAREGGLETLQLEVLAQNVRAYKTYQRVGFTTTRRLFGLELATTALPASESALPVELIAVETLLPWLAGNPQVCWSCEPASILTSACEAFKLSDTDGQPNALIVQRGHGRVSILAALVQDELTEAGLVALLRKAAGLENNIYLYNAPEESAMLAHCQALGFTETYSQYEMLLTL
jgi:ribosomal protein S18 acetylase RimI-like enzyme